MIEHGICSFPFSESKNKMKKAKINLNPKKYPNLCAAQKLTVTDQGQDINRDCSLPLTNSAVEMLRKDPKMSDEKRLVMSPPFSNMDKIIDHLFLTSLAGLTIENLEQNRISLVINVTHEMPLLYYKSIETFRIPVRHYTDTQASNVLLSRSRTTLLKIC